MARDGLSQHVSGRIRDELLGGLSLNETVYDLAMGENLSYVMVRGHLSGFSGFFRSFFRKVGKFRIVIEKASNKVIRVKVNQ
jgi:hypothetical protein